MIPLLMIAGLALVISLMSTTPETRAAARKRLARHNWKLWTFSAVIWGSLLFPYN